MRVAVSLKRQAGGIVTLTLLWLVGIAAIFYVCTLRDLPGIQARLALAANTAVTSAGVAGASVTLDGRDAILSGEVISQQHIDTAVVAVRQVEGVRQVQNRLTVIPPPPVVARLRPPQFNLQKAEGVITLSGLLPSEDSAALLLEGVQQSFPSYSLDNSILVDATAGEPIWLETTLSSLSALKQVDETSIDIEGDGVTVGGKVSSQELKESIEQSLLSTFTGPMEITSNLEVLEILPRLEAELGLTLSQRELTLTGQVRSSTDIEKIAGSVMSSFDLDLVNNQLKINADVADALWLDSISTLLPQLNELSSLEIIINADTASIKGEAPDPAERDNTVALIDGSIGELLPVDILITVPQSQPDSPVDSQPDSVTSPEVLPGVESEKTTTGAADQEQRRQALKKSLEAIDTSTIQFDTGSAELTPDSKSVLARIAAILVRFQDIDVTVSAFTDSNGEEQDNLQLSQVRAEAVVAYLLQNEVSAERLQAQGVGEAEPISDNTTPEGRAKNRRIEFNY